MSNNSLTSSPARSSISTTGIVGANASANAVASSSSLAIDDLHFSPDLVSIHDRKDEALLVLKSDLMAALNKQVKSMDEDSWMFEGPRSRIQLISKPGGRLNNHAETELSRVPQKRSQYPVTK